MVSQAQKNYATAERHAQQVYDISMPDLKDFNPQKAALIDRIITFASARPQAQRGNQIVFQNRTARLVDALDIAPSFGAAIERVYHPDDAEHLHALGMAELALQAVNWLETTPSESSAPEWLRKTGVSFEWILQTK